MPVVRGQGQGSGALVAAPVGSGGAAVAAAGELVLILAFRDIAVISPVV